MKEAGEDKKKKDKINTDKAQKISNWVKQIANKVPQITKLEKKLGMLQGLDPVLEGIVTDLNKVTDYSGMIKLQGGKVEEPPKPEEPAEKEEGEEQKETEDAQPEAKADDKAEDKQEAPPAQSKEEKKKEESKKKK